MHRVTARVLWVRVLWVRVLMARILIAGIGAASGSAAQAHQIERAIAECACDSGCFTAEVSALRCSGDSFSFAAHGLPDAAHPLMVGITGNNQQMPIEHNLTFRLPRTPALAASATATKEGAIGVAVNGVPLFSPDTQGAIQADTGRPVSAAAQGELDLCGGHAGRGDDYHYHRAPNCLIDALGAAAIETRAQPIGYAADGFPILALGWFEAGNDIEDSLDDCRGARDATGRYFYNVEHGGDLAILDCYAGTPIGFARDTWDQRRDASGREIVGIPIGFAVESYAAEAIGGETCHRQTGTLSGEQLVTSAGKVVRPGAVQGSLFHCSPGCYGMFVEVKGTGAGGRSIGFEMVTDACPQGLSPQAVSDNGFGAYRLQ